MRRILGSLLVLALGSAVGCSKSNETPAGGSAESATVQPRALPAIWADILAQRDRVHAAVSKGTDMWHEDCAEVSSAAAAMDALLVELNRRVAEEPSLEARRRHIDELVGYLQVTSSTLREKAVDEVVGPFPALMIGLDAVLKSVEGAFTSDEIGSESVVTRPGFNTVRPARAASPV